MKYAIYNIIPSYGEKRYHHTTVHISPDRKEWIEDRSKYGYKDTPKSQFKPMDVVMTHWIWLRKHYVVPSRFRLMDENGNIIETMEVNPKNTNVK